MTYLEISNCVKKIKQLNYASQGRLRKTKTFISINLKSVSRYDVKVQKPSFQPSVITRSDEPLNFFVGK